jgi:membrane associated rhomboid family serine protease
MTHWFRFAAKGCVMLIPIRTNSLYNQTPVANCVVMAVTILVSILALSATSAASVFSPPGWVDSMVLQGWSVSGLFGHMLLHGGIWHLVGNMIFLWVFGNAVCAKTGSKWYVPIYLLCGLGAATLYNLFSNDPMLGASGAIYGIIGFYLVLQPVNDIEMFWFFFFRWGKFSMPGYWVPWIYGGCFPEHKKLQMSLMSPT